MDGLKTFSGRNEQKVVAQEMCQLLLCKIISMKFFYKFYERFDIGTNPKSSK